MKLYELKENTKIYCKPSDDSDFIYFIRGVAERATEGNVRAPVQAALFFKYSWIST